MAYRRRHGIARESTFKDDTRRAVDDGDSDDNSSNSPSLAAQAIRAVAVTASSCAGHESSLSPSSAVDRSFPRNTAKVFDAYESAPERNEFKGLWGIIARKAKALLEDDADLHFENDPRARSHISDATIHAEVQQPSSTPGRKMDNPTLRKGLNKITSSLNQIGDTFEKAFEEGRSIVENKTAGIIQETRKLQIRRKESCDESQQQSLNHETQLKASRDVAMATAAKAKLLLRELKAVKADLAFARVRCSQLEDENKVLREGRDKGTANHADDDDLIRLQLETLLAEKARLAHENSVYARENRFLSEIVEFHQLSMQDVVYFDEPNEEVKQVYHPVATKLSVSPPPLPPPPPTEEEEAAPDGSHLNSHGGPCSHPEPDHGDAADIPVA